MRKSSKKLLGQVGDIAIGVGHLLNAKGTPSEEDLKDLEKCLQGCAKTIRRVRKIEHDMRID